MSTPGTCRALSDAAERTANVGEDGKEERKGLYAAIYKRDYYVNNVDANGGNLEGKEQCLGSSGDEEEISQKKVDFSSSIICFASLLISGGHGNHSDRE